MIVTKNNGFQFLGFLVVNENEIYNYHQLAGSYAVIKCDDKYLLCYNTLRKQWELPAGQRETNETPKGCAIRELYEETGQRVLNMEFKGLLKVKNVRNNAIKYNPVYFTILEKLEPFQKNDETSEILLWNFGQKIGPVDEVDLKIFDFIK